METNYFVEPEYPFWNKLKKGIRFYGNLTIAIYLSFIVLRILEFATLSITRTPPVQWAQVLELAFLFDLVSYLKISIFLSVPTLIIFMLFRYNRRSYVFFGSLGSVLIALYVCLIHYFETTLVPLGADLFGYSWKEIMHTVQASGDFSVVNLLMILFPVAIFWILLYAFYLKPLMGFYLSLVQLILGFAAFYLNISCIPPAKWIKNEYDYTLSINKLGYFLERTLEDNTHLDRVNLDEIPSEKTSFKYIDAQYPFLRTEDTPDVLGAYFTINSTQKPNIVFIQVEGLGRAFSGKNAYLGSFTPFLDSLANSGLYWENFLAAQGRTFGALPSILGSLPFAEEGFNALDTNMPKHFTLFNVLKKSGYKSSFIAGTDLEFDQQGAFLRKQGTDELIGIRNYSQQYQKIHTTPEADSWGYPDGEIYRRALDKTLFQQEAPFISYIQSISMHSPYRVPNQAHYVSEMENRLNQLGIPETKKYEYRRYQSIYSSILYADESLKKFFEAVKRSPGYERSIFIITGDHRLPEIPLATKIDRYHVPLIIVSPLLKRSARFSSISSHLDLAPSVLAFLHQNFKVHRPRSVTWLGSGLDTVRQFRNVHQIPLKQVKSELRNYLSGLYFLDGKQVFQVYKNLDIEPVEDAKQQEILFNGFRSFKQRNEHLIRHKILVPDAVFRSF